MSSVNNINENLLKNIKIKQEKCSPPQSPCPELRKKELIESKKTQLTIINNDINIKTEKTDEEKNEKKQPPEQLLKSSNELLAELFKVFNSVPPDTIHFKHQKSKSKKKHKHKHKKKHKKRSLSSSNDDEDDDDDYDDSLSKRKRKKRKKSKSRKSSINIELNNKKQTSKICELKTEKSERLHTQKTSKNSSKYSNSKYDTIADLDIHAYEKQLETTALKSDIKVIDKQTLKQSGCSRKIIIKDLKNSAVYAETVSQAKAYEESKKKNQEDGELSDSISSRSSSISLSDEETYLRNRHERYSRNSSYSRTIGSTSLSYRDRYKDHFHRDRRSSRNDSRSYRSRTDRSRRSRSRLRRSRDNSEDRIDKKRLLEIARKNAILMFKSGMLPGVQNMAPEAKERILTKMRYGGKSVEELTEFCKKLSNGESSGYLSNISDDSEHDGDGNEKAFNHPFVLKDRGPIVMNIKNSTPIAPKTAEQTKAILLQFPVSSGQHHRLNENEWVPVTPKPKVKLNTKPPIKQIDDSQLELASTPTQSIASNSIPAVLSVEAKQLQMPQLVDSVPQSDQATSCTEPQPPQSQQQSVPVENVFESMLSKKNMDVTSIITNRLNAMRKLQDNPYDHEALYTMHSTQRDMSEWANSKFVPGQFTGSTGATILTPKELTAGVQAWAKRDQMMTTTPVTGGMGMHILQKMGWKPGEGLGKERNGSLQPLLLEVKLDKKGLANEEDRGQRQQPNVQQPKRKRLGLNTAVNMAVQNKHPVSLLGELAAKRKWLAPLYEQVFEGGPHHSRQFFFKVSINGIDYKQPHPANNKKEAKAAAARFALQEMGVL